MRRHHAVPPAAVAWSVATSAGGGSLAGGPEGTSRSVSFDRACAVVTGAATAAGSATGLGGRESTMNLSPRSHARALASGPGAGVGVSSIVTTFRLKALSSRRTKLS
jgi:hypothetical protein